MVIALRNIQISTMPSITHYLVSDMLSAVIWNKNVHDKRRDDGVGMTVEMDIKAIAIEAYEIIRQHRPVTDDDYVCL